MHFRPLDADEDAAAAQRPYQPQTVPLPVKLGRDPKWRQKLEWNQAVCQQQQLGSKRGWLCAERLWHSHALRLGLRPQPRFLTANSRTLKLNLEMLPVIAIVWAALTALFIPC